MYSYQIDELLRNNNYCINSELFFHVCETSSQINHIKYDAFQDRLDIWTVDGFYWNIKVIK